MKFDLKTKLAGAPRLGAMIATAILGTVEAVTTTVEDIAMTAKNAVTGKKGE